MDEKAQFERIPIEDPGTEGFEQLGDPDCELQDPDELYRTSSRPLAGIVLPGTPLARVADAPAKEAESRSFGPTGSMIFSQNGDRLIEDPSLDDSEDCFVMETLTDLVSAEASAKIASSGLPDDETAAIDAEDAADGSQEPDLALAARRLLDEGGDSGAPKTELEQLQAELEEQLLRAMARRLSEPDWYLTGVEVGLQSLHRLYESSRLVYANYRHRSAGVAKVQNLRVVYEQLLAFRTADGALERGRILIEHRNHFEELLGDIQDGRRSRGLASVNLTLYEQVAKDLTEAVNRQRTYQNLIRAIEGIAKLPKMMQRTRDKKAAALVESYKQLLVGLEWNDPESFRTKGQLTHKARQLRDKIRRSRRHLQQVRDELYRDMPFAIDNPDMPELDLDARKVIPFLRRSSKHGLDYLSRAFSVYEHALESSASAQKILARVEELEALEAAGGAKMAG